MSFTVLEPGLYSRLVQAGRVGRRSLGVPLGGPADRASWILGNALVGNFGNEHALEITLTGPTLGIDKPIHAAVFGAPFHLRKNRDIEIVPGTTFNLEPGDTLKIGGTPTGCRVYLCVTGGFTGGSLNDPVKAGQILECRESRGSSRSLGFVNLTPAPRFEWGLRALPGSQDGWFPGGEFWSSEFRVAPASDRMGLRLLGNPIRKRVGDMVSEAVAPGVVQVANDGLPIVLGVDGQTIGGYPKVAHVIAADLDLLGQLRPGDSVRFQKVTLEEAEAANRARRKDLENWKMRLGIRLDRGGNVG